MGISFVTAINHSLTLCTVLTHTTSFLETPHMCLVHKKSPLFSLSHYDTDCIHLHSAKKITLPFVSLKSVHTDTTFVPTMHTLSSILSTNF
jgi:hypothetical protein